MTLILRDLRYQWPDAAEPVLNIPEFTLAAGERLLLRGPSGCGKSTLLAALSGVIDVATGAVDVAGTDVGALPPSRRDAFRVDHIGIVFQAFNLIPWLSARDNITLPCTFSARRRGQLVMSPKEDADALLAALNLASLADTVAGALSHGQQQRVAAARALIGGPDLIVADEPTSALDPDAKENFMHLLSGEAARTGAALLVVSHDPGLESHFDRVINMSDINFPKGAPC
ncbi:putative ABC transporter ATP-binding protein [Shimia sp. SK013]|uniref:ATP-binding cassette domain-containing protein n=1 Tax=Shimia sp. SK013 TaxID=1389006 RepID=UPI0006B58307|nr:ATP-binding cassette domain-containing protein [Shimia sp. SK013]KPA23141.1 putative ABC transporter ATP-binding protein [Shimia sp. SK013]